MLASFIYRTWVLGAGCWVLGALTTEIRAQAPRTRPTALRVLPAVPRITGPLSITVVYPLPGQRIEALDTTFLFGSVGSGGATLTVNGFDVTVAPNGAFLAWVPVPLEDSASVFRFVARQGVDSVAHDLVVQIPRIVTNPDTGLWIEEGSLSPRGVQWLEPGELVRVSATATPGALVTLELPGRPPLVLVPDTAQRITYGPFDRTLSRTPATETRYVGVFAAGPIGPGLEDVLPIVGRAPPVAWDSSRSAHIRVATEQGVLRVPLELRMGLIDPAHRPVVILDDDTLRAANTDGAVAGTPLPRGTFHWFFRNGTPAAVSGRVDTQVRLRLSNQQVAWVDISSLAAALPAGTPEPRGILRLVRAFAQERSVAVRLALTQRVPFRVDEDGNRISVRLYGTTMDLDWIQYGSTDPFIERITWDQATRDEGTVTVELNQPVFGHRMRWEGSDLILEIRRPPVVNARFPLRGRLIAIDAGHPPIGATGPTGLTEANANLAVGRALRRVLERAGARVIMTRDADTAVGLYERVNLAERENAEILVSIHNNAFPDGVNPFLNNGTSTYYYQPRSERLARLVQEGLVREMGLRDLGFGRGDLALVRPTWMPAVLTEGAFLMIPEQENALRTPAFQERYARGVMQGIERYLREMVR